MPLHCICIDMQPHAFDFLPIKCQACPFRPYKFGILTAYIWSIIIHFVFFQTRYFSYSFTVISSPSVFFSLFVINFQHSPINLCICLLVCGNYVVGVEHCFNWTVDTTSLAADGFGVCSLVTS